MIVGIVLIFVLATVLWFLTTAVSGNFLRFVLGSVIGIALAAFGIGFFRSFAGSPPPHMKDSSPQEVPEEYGLAYVCEMCGLELSVIRVAQERAPKHCGEEMALVRRKG